MGFIRWIEDNEKLIEELIEAAGNLKGLPKPIIKAIVDTNSGTGNAGKNSEFVLFKKDAKQSDLTSACKSVGGFVKPGEEGYRVKSKAELEAEARKSANAGVLVKINGKWAFYAAWDEYTKKFKLISNDGYIRKDGSIFVSTSNYRYVDGELTATDLSNYINFKEDTVDIYLVTADVERELKRQERREVKDAINDVKKVTPERKKAITEFLKKRSNGIIDELTADIKESTDKLNEYVESSINRAVLGKETIVDLGNFQGIMTELDKKLKRINSLGYHIAKIAQEGKIKETRWSTGNEDSYHYKTFKSLVDAYEKEMK